MTRRLLTRRLVLALLALALVAAGAAARPLAFGDPPTAPDAPVLSGAEIAFIQDMTAHHQQAVAMTQLLDPEVPHGVAGLARQIGDSQRVEIGMMLGWLRLAGATVTNPEPMAWMHDAGHDPHAGPQLMPGMASAAELDALAAARGLESAALFLQLMHRHHVAGVQMAQAADQRLESGPVQQAAREMIQDQSHEVGVMTLLLDQLGVGPLSAHPD